MKQMKIISDGTPPGTKLLDPDGKDITGSISAITWKIVAGGASQATVTFENVQVEVLGIVKDGRSS